MTNLLSSYKDDERKKKGRSLQIQRIRLGHNTADPTGINKVIRRTL